MRHKASLDNVEAESESGTIISFDEDEMVKDAKYQELRKIRAGIYDKISVHSISQPSRKEGTYYWLKDTDGQAIERCCCPRDSTTGMKKDGMQCKYLHAFRESYSDYAENFLGLKQSINPTKWNAWVCPGTTGMPEGLGWHHPDEDEASDLAQCEHVKKEFEEAEEQWQQEQEDLEAELADVDGELRDLLSGWGCRMVLTGREKVDGTYCGAGGLTNVHNCRYQKGACYTTACYRCDRFPDKLFHKRKGEGMVIDEATGNRYISTSGAVKAYALEQCRMACSA